VSDSKSDSVTQNKRSFTIAASPLNPVKFELGIILFIGFFLLISVQGFFEAPIVQLGVLLGYGTLSMAWLIYRTKRLVKQNESDQIASESNKTHEQ